MLKDLEPPKESARDKAERIWRNNQIINNYRPRATSQKPEPTLLEKINPESSRRIKCEIEKILAQKHDNMIRNYVISLKVRRHKLLKEKLKRLLERNHE
jgi:hypothetical protein